MQNELEGDFYKTRMCQCQTVEYALFPVSSLLALLVCIMLSVSTYGVREREKKEEKVLK